MDELGRMPLRPVSALLVICLIGGADASSREQTRDPEALTPGLTTPSVLLPTIRPIRGANGRSVNFEIRAIFRDGFVGVRAGEHRERFVEWISTDLSWITEFQRDLDQARNAAELYTGPLRKDSASIGRVLRPIQPNGVLLELKSETDSSQNTRWSSPDGSFDRDVFNSRRLEIKLRRIAEGDSRVRVEWYFLARDVRTRKAWVFDAGARDVDLPSGRNHQFVVESPKLALSDQRVNYDSETRFRERSGNLLSGYGVAVWSGDVLVTVRGNASGTVEWLREQLESPDFRRPMVGEAWMIDEDVVPRVIESERPRYRDPFFAR